MRRETQNKKFDKNKWNPRYLLYCELHGFKNNPEGMRIHDKNMTNFIAWNHKMISKFQQKNGLHSGSLLDHEKYDRWLIEQIKEN